MDQSQFVTRAKRFARAWRIIGQEGVRIAGYDLPLCMWLKKLVDVTKLDFDIAVIAYEELTSVGITTAGELADADPDILFHACLQMAKGIDDEMVSLKYIPFSRPKYLIDLEKWEGDIEQ